MPYRPEFEAWLNGWQDWLDHAEVAVGTPYLLSPAFEYDTELNSFFRSSVMLHRPENSLAAYARDMAAFFTFLWVARDRKSWRAALEADHLAYKSWRTKELHCSGSTWGREVATVNVFYKWALQEGICPANPIPQRAARLRPRGRLGSAASEVSVPATGPHHARREKIQWLPPKSYREWRDIGIRGYGLDGLPDAGFRGRWIGRNAAFCDLMVRTGLRRAEQNSLTVFDLPRDPLPSNRGYQRFWLPASIAKWGSARWIYVPVGTVRELSVYRELDRKDIVESARARGIYRRIRSPLVIQDPSRPEIILTSGLGAGKRVQLEHMSASERQRVFIDTNDGLEPAAFWLSEEGMPLAAGTWTGIFATASDRCEAKGSEVRCHPHMLRHSFAVVTLEQLQRGHLRELSGMSPAQRTHYTQVFGDPLDWVRRRLGHASVATTQAYLHCLAELEMETRMELVPDSWADPRDSPLEFVSEENASAKRSNRSNGEHGQEFV
ncbi:hypothetical protein A5664_18025 [Mycolicibacterium fortuitum]|nr:hypothetical protein A5664_18025 [Mycolicibacterium fortuitum]